MNEHYYVQTVTGGIHPHLYGPYPTDDERDEMARIIHADQDPAEDAVFAVDVLIRPVGHPLVNVYSYSGAFFKDSDPVAPNREW